MSTPKTRITQFIDYQKISRRTFCEKIGVSHTYFSNNSSLSSDVMENIFTNYPELNMDWVVTGRGEMVINWEIPIPNNLKENIMTLLQQLPPGSQDIFGFENKTGVDSQRISRIIWNNEWPSKHEIALIALGFNIPMDKLLYADLKNNKPYTEETQYLLNDTGEELQIANWKQKYYDLLERYTSLLEQQNKLKDTG